MAYAHVEPFGEERADYRAALVAMTVANAFRSRPEPYKLKEFLLTFGQPAEADPADQLEELRRRFRAAAVKEKHGRNTRHSPGRPRRRR